MNQKVSVTGKPSSEFATHNSTAKHIQSATTRTANMKGKAGSEDNWSKERDEKHPASEQDGAARPTASLRKLRSQDRVKSPVATRYVLDSDSEESANTSAGGMLLDASTCQSVSARYGGAGHDRSSAIWPDLASGMPPSVSKRSAVSKSTHPRSPVTNSTRSRKGYQSFGGAVTEHNPDSHKKDATRIRRRSRPVLPLASQSAGFSKAFIYG